MLKKKTLTETIYNNGDPFQIRETISACIGAWQKQDKYDILWETLEIETAWEEPITLVRPDVVKVFNVSVEAV